MMKRKAILFATLAVALAAAVSCQKEEEGRHITFSASIDQNFTKTAIDQTGTGSSTNITTIKWQQGDCICIYDGTAATSTNDPKKQFRLISFGANEGIGNFDGTISNNASTFVSVYPYRKDYTFTLNSTSTVATIGGIVVTGVQTPTNGSYDPSAAVMTGFCKDSDSDRSTHMLYFKNLCALIKVVAPFDCSSIIVTNPETSDPLVGKVTVDVDIDATHTVDQIGTPSNIQVDATNHSHTVVLQGDIESGNTYYIAVLPGTYNQLSFTFVAKEAQPTAYYYNESSVEAAATNQFLFIKKTINSSSVALQSAQVLSLPSFALTGTGHVVWDYTYEMSNVSHNGHAYADLNYANETGSSRLVWATCNVGATAPTQIGSYYAWGETWLHYSGTPGTASCTWLNDTEHGHDYTASTGGGFSFDSYHYCDSTGSDSHGYFTGSNTNGPTGGTSAIYGSNGVLLGDYDVALQEWNTDGSSSSAWRMPTEADFQQLIDNTNYLYLKNFMNSGVNGMLFMSQTKNHGCIFMPMTGCVLHTSKRDIDVGFYWSSSMDTQLASEGNMTRAKFFRIEKDLAPSIESRYRIYGRLVRPVASISNTGSK